MKQTKNSNEGFTLIELLLVIIILAVLVGLITSNLLTSVKRGRDQRRKSDLAQIQRALELYYEDVKSYPASLPLGSGLSSGTKMYMMKLPNDPLYSSTTPINTSTYSYIQGASGQSYVLLSCIENTQDSGVGVSQSGFKNGATLLTCGGCGTCKYLMGSYSITPFPTAP